MQVESWGNKKDIEYRVKCDVCGCKFRFKRSEIFDEKDRFSVAVGYINCPQCNDEKHFYGCDLRDCQITKFDKFITLIKNGFKTSMIYIFRR